MGKKAVLSPGCIVQVRSRRWLVEEVVPPPRPGDATLVRASCVDDDAQGQPLEVLWEREIDAEVLTGESWDRLARRGFDPPHIFSAYLHTLGWNCITATDPRLFQAPFRAGIKIESFQLEPLRKALLLPRVNLFIADDVGLGKTIEAGLIARELLLRKKARDIVVACPPSMLLQWREELETRFGLVFEILDREYIARVRQERGFGVNPWMTHTRFLISHRLLIDEAYVGPMRDWLGELRPGALLILDEAHHAAPASGARYAIDSKITRAVRDIAPRFEHRLFLSATPHNGHSNSFSALLEILDPQRFCRGVPVRGRKILEDIMVRRLKEDVREVAGGFPKRRILQVDISGLPEDAPELLLPRLLDEYREMREVRLAGETKRTQAASGLLICGLQQRLLSSFEAFWRTLRVHRRTVQRQWEAAGTGKAMPRRTRSPRDLNVAPPDADDDRSLLTDEQLQAEEEARMEEVTLAAAGSLEGQQGRALFAKEQAIIERMADIADDARGRPDARVRWLIDWIRTNMCPDLPKPGKNAPAGKQPQWNDLRIIIFTEYEDTKRYLHEQLAAAIAGTDRADERIRLFCGSTPQGNLDDGRNDTREYIKKAFTADPHRQPVRILIATDAAREGLNLQSRCWNIFHFDVPWNPGRLEQRNGRIDRKLQPNPEVFCRYFVHTQRPEDRVLQVLVKKTETIKKQLGSLAQVVESKLAVSLRDGIRRGRVAELTREIETADLDAQVRKTVEEELEESSLRQDDLRKEIEKLRTLLENSREWIGLEEEHFRAAISSSLEIMGAEPLRRPGAAHPGNGGPDRWEMPLLHEREGADPTWIETLDTLRAPRQRGQNFWEWRREAPLRPVVFEDPGTMDDEVVHLHLEQRLVQRLLGRFVAQGFVHHDLSRACLAQTSDAIPRVVLIGRLSLYGPGAARLHEEMILLTARWLDPLQRKVALAPYAREAEEKTLALLEKAFLASRPGQVPERHVRRLQETAPRDIQELLPHLSERGEEIAKEAEARLTDRGRREAKAMRDTIEAQRGRIEETFKKHLDPQLELGFDTDEKRQLESNKRHWEKRLAAIAHELAHEPDRIRDLYRVRAKRIEPVGVAYLWPATG